MLKNIVFLALSLLLLSFTAAQTAPQIATISGVLENERGIQANTRVGVHLLDENNGGLFELTSVQPVANTFSIGTADPSANHLIPWTNGLVLLPGLQNQYRLEPENVPFTRALTNVYVDNGNGKFDGNVVDPLYLGVASLKEPLGFFVLIYVDQNVRLISSEAELNFTRGWNIFTVRFPNDGKPIYAVTRSVSDASLDVFLPSSTIGN